jgi:hypothetical protein
MGGTTFGIGLPYSYPTSQLNPFTPSPYGMQSFGSFPGWGQQQQYAQPLQQILQILQIVPQQLQQLQQVLQTIPAQLAQLQQLIQFAPQQIQQGPSLGGFPPTPQWGISPQVFGPQPGHVM